MYGLGVTGVHAVHVDGAVQVLSSLQEWDYYHYYYYYYYYY